jgi:hypothetical protein
VGQHNLELRKINRHIVNVNRVSIPVACAGKDRPAGVKHNGNTIALGSAIQKLQFLHPFEIVIRIEELVRRMNS